MTICPRCVAREMAAIHEFLLTRRRDLRRLGYERAARLANLVRKGGLTTAHQSKGSPQ